MDSKFEKCSLSSNSPTYIYLLSTSRHEKAINLTLLID